jgi:hypothetical protein
MCCNFWYDCFWNDRYYIINALTWCIPLYLFFLSFMFIQTDFVFGMFVLIMSSILLCLRTYTEFYIEDADDDV